jgi:hypothetical protein
METINLGENFIKNLPQTIGIFIDAGECLFYPKKYEMEN